MLVSTTPNNPFEKFKTKRIIRKLHDGLFTETTIHRPVKIDGVIRWIGIGLPKYKLNNAKYLELVALLEKRAKLRTMHDYFFDHSGRYPKDIRWENKRLTIVKRIIKIFEKLNAKFDYPKLFCSPPNSTQYIPFFDLRYLSHQEDLKKWAKVVKLELQQHYIYLKSERGRPAKEEIYTPEVFEAFDKYLAYAKKNKKSVEIDKNPNYWAAEETMKEFPSFNIRASQLIKLGQSRRRNKA
jgi:hypothetical protein